MNLVPKGDRKEQSHAIVVRLRPALEEIARPAGARMKMVEIPPGPPVLDTIVAEVYGPSEAERTRLAEQVLEAFLSTEGVVDVDSTLNPTAPKLLLVLDREKAALHGVPAQAVVQTLAAAGYGAQLGHVPRRRGASSCPSSSSSPRPARRRRPAPAADGARHARAGAALRAGPPVRKGARRPPSSTRT